MHITDLKNRGFFLNCITFRVRNLLVKSNYVLTKNRNLDLGNIKKKYECNVYSSFSSNTNAMFIVF